MSSADVLRRLGLEDDDYELDYDPPGGHSPAWKSACVMVWFGAIATPLFSIANMRWHELARWSEAQTAPNWWALDNSWLLWIPVGLFAMAGIGVMFGQADIPRKFAWLVLVLLASAGWNLVMTRPHHTIVRGEVTVRPLVPWAADQRFAFSDAKILARGCDYTYGRGRIRNTLIFEVRSSAGSVVNLGGGVSRAGMDEWMRVMQPYINGSISLHADQSRVVAHDPKCIEHFTRDLTATQRSTFLKLLN